MAVSSVSHQAVRYGLVGAIIVALDYLVFYAMLFLAPSAYLVANLAGKVAGALLGFFLHRHFTFAWQQRDEAPRQFISYSILLTGNLIMSSALLWLMIENLHINAFFARLATDGVVITTSFVLSRLWVYRQA